jgi:outer membrane protein
MCKHIFNGILACAIVVLFILHFTGNKPGSKGKTASVDHISIAYVNTDTIWEKYDFVKDTKKELETVQTNMQTQYQAMVQSYQTELNNYMQKAKSYQLTLDQQKQKEEQLGKKQQEILEMEQKLSTQLLEIKQAKNAEVHDTIVNFIRKFNKDKNYTLILEYSYTGGLLYASDSLNITKEVISGLNKEYPKVKAHREK